jgi:hypothetical protein
MKAASLSLALFLPLIVNAAPSSCEALAKFALPDAAITLAQSVPAGEFSPLQKASAPVLAILRPKLSPPHSKKFRHSVA